MQKTIWKSLLSFVMISTAFSAYAEEADSNWMRYPGISPDGQEIAFSHQGNIYKVGVEGGTATPLTIGKNYHFRPVWSFDGAQIAYASDKHGNFDVFVMPAEGGKAKRLTTHSGPDEPEVFAPDGDKIYFTGKRTPNAANIQFPYPRFTHLYAAATDGSGTESILPFPVQRININKAGDQMLYQDHKGYEDYWRKHHESSVARDIWVYDKNTGEHRQLTTFVGEDRNPVWAPDQKHVYYLSQEEGTLNIWKLDSENPDDRSQITTFDTHPVRFLTVAENGTLCFGYHGNIYTMKEGETPQKLDIRIPTPQRFKETERKIHSKGATEMVVSPNGKEMAFVIRGEVFVTSIDNKLTKRITNTPGQARSVSFSPDGKKLLYAAERDGSWNLYESKIKDSDNEPYFYAASLIEETPILETDAETFQPAYSPDGKEVAFLEERTTLRVLNLKSNKTRTVLPGDKNYSYSDGDQHYDWSPDGKWFLVTFIEKERWVSEVGLVKADGNEEVINLSESGYAKGSPTWVDENTFIFTSDKFGYRSHGSWGSERDVYAHFLTQEAHDRFKLSKEELELLEAREKEEDKKDKEEDKEVKIEWNQLEDRVERLTLSAHRLSSMAITPDGEKLFYLASRDGGADLWELETRTKKTKNISFLKGGGSLQMDKEGKTLFVGSRGQIQKLDIQKGQLTPISFAAEMYLTPSEERAYIFEHLWRQTLKKFYVKDMHGVDWEAMKAAYEPKLGSIDNNYDFAEMTSELLGELNASHTGTRYTHRDKDGDKTASLGILISRFDPNNGVKIAEIIDKSPLQKADAEVEDQFFIQKINGTSIENLEHYYSLLNHQAGKNLRLEVVNSDGKKAKSVMVKPITLGQENNLLYERWVKTRREATEKLSDGKIGYVHVRGMNSMSFREVYSEMLGRHNDKEAVIVDTRFNGGGWLHDDLATLLSGEKYVTLKPRGQVIGSEPQSKWQRASIVLAGEGNYSDAHFFPVAYRSLGIGEIVGMPVPGTTTAVWWEQQIDPTLVFGIPQVGVVDMDGDYLENKQLEPDHKVKNLPTPTIKGKDAQLEKAVELLLKK